MTSSVAETGLEIAIIGIAGRFPGAPTLDLFWDNLCHGVESITRFEPTALTTSGAEVVKASAMLDDIERFDAAFFGMSPREAEVLDPQQRLFLECAWEAIESAGYNIQRYDGSVGVYAGVGINTYLLRNLYSNPALIDLIGEAQVKHGNDKDFLSTRVSYLLNLDGPSVVVQTACSTSLVAVHLACRSLLSGECDMALAGGASIRTPQEEGYAYREGGITAPDGHCRAFDAQAHGTVFGNGVGVVLLKRLEDAMNDGDPIHAVIKGSAINNDGSNKVGFTAPSVEGQTRVIKAAYMMAEVEPETISYIETHGTGTKLGDPLEITALTKAFRSTTDRQQFCAIGALKPNIGHLDTAAGVAGLIKATLALKHGQIPPLLHFERANPAIDFANSPFYVHAKATAWQRNGVPRRAGVSAFGIGGTNAHVVLEEAPPLPESGSSRSQQLLVISAKTAAALETATGNLAAHLSAQPELNLADVAYTLQVGRQPFTQRRFVVCGSRAEAIAALEGAEQGRSFSGTTRNERRPLAFLFSGQGSQYVNMARELYDSEPVFREAVDRCAELLKPHMHPRASRDLRELVYPSAEAKTASEQLAQTAFAQPALFMIEYALAQLWIRLGAQPQALIGHSIGEYVAATLAGVFSLEDALALVAARGRLMNDLPGGAMLAVSLAEAAIQPLLNSELSIAAINAPDLCVVSGSHAAIEALESQLNQSTIHARRLHASHAFHSPMIEPMLEPFGALVQGMRLNPPRIPFVSNLTGDWITAEQATDPAYWVQHTRQPVRFLAGLDVLLADSEWGLLEIGPGSALSQFARRHPACGLERPVISSLPHPQEQQPADAFFFTALGKLWLAGVDINWQQLYRHEQRRRVVLPTYPWQRERYWIEPGTAQASSTVPPSLERQPDLADWFYLPTWREAAPPTASLDESRRWLIFADGSGVSAALAQRLRQQQQQVIVVSAGSSFGSSDDQTYVLNPGQRDDYQRLIAELRKQDRLPQQIIHAWSIAQDDSREPAVERLEAAQDRGFYSLLFLAQALGEIPLPEQIRIAALTNGAHEVESSDRVQPEQALVLGPCKVIPLEYELLGCRSIDIQLPKAESRQARQLIDQLIAELAAPNDDQIVAYRGRHRWVRTYSRAPLSTPTTIDRLRERGVYLITGGLGGMSLQLGQQLAEMVQARLILVSRSELPPRANWDALVTGEDRIAQQIRAIQAIEAAGSEVLIVSADVNDPAAMHAVKIQALERFGAIHGLIHAAGVGGGGLIQIKTRAAAEEVLAPKTRGLLVLAEIAADLELDFFAIFSSLASILGAFGRVDYCAANAFVDAFAYRHSALTGTDTFTINWQTWQETGMSVNTIVPEELSDLRELMIEDGLLPSEGVELFRRVLAHNRHPQIAISTKDLSARIESVAEVSRARQQAALQPGQHPRPAHTRPDLATAYIAPSSITEEAVAAIWQELLGIDQIGVHDNFFELGGHSLLATQIVFRIRDTLQIELTLGSFFETPTVAGVAAAIDRRQTAPAGAESIPLPVLVPQPEAWYQPFPLTDMQQAYWIGRSGAFDMGNVSIHLYLEIESETLDVVRFNRAWQLLVQRHDMLRAIVQPDGQQRILETVPDYQIAVLDLRDEEPGRASDKLAAIREEMSHQVLPTDQWPLFDVRASLLANGRTRLHLSVDGIFADGRSYQILSHDLIELYADPAAFPEPFTISFRDYVLALRTFEESEAFQRSLSYWRDRLPTLPPAPELPLAAAPGSIEQPHFVRRSATLEPEIWQALKTRSGQRGLTPTGLLLAVYAEVLARWSKSPHFTINVPRFNRLPLHDEVSSIIGEFASFTLLEVDQRQPAPFALRAQRLQEQLWQDLEHQYISGVRVLREMARAQGIVSGAAMPVVFTSVLNLNVTIQAASAFDRLGDLVYSIAQTPQVWLDFTVGEDGGTLFFHWDAVDELFPAGMFDAMFAAYYDFLHQLAADDAAWEAPIRQLVPVDQLEQRSVLNATERVYPAHESLHRLIEAQVERTPEAIALIAEAGVLSYHDLNQRANQVAHHLQSLGVGANRLVGICMERSLELMVGLLGILKAGGAYVPLDPDYPAERLEWMLDDARVPVLLTQERLLERLRPESSHRQAAIVCLDRDWPAIAQGCGDTLAPSAALDDLAYVIYTSGSTGRPKGVMNTHRAICNRLLWMQDAYQLDATDRVLQKTPFSFDVSVWEFFWPLITGAGLVMARPGGHQDPGYLTEIIAEQHITTIHFVPSMLEHFLSAPDVSQCRSLRRVVCSGEALTFELQQRFFAHLDAELHNLYGPTEAAVDVTAWACRPDTDRHTVPIGYPIANIQMHIVDSQMQPVPLWVPGELLIGGVGLARGYINRSDLTAERFIPDPFTEASGARLYRTGDLARYLPDGSIEFLGRLDHQIKLRGFRIELGEIEVVLRTYPGLREAVVVAREDAPGDMRLVAYVVGEQKSQEPKAQISGSHVPEASKLRAFLQEHLPDYMVPSAFVVLDALPLSPNGKLDRKALPAPDAARPELAVGYVAPRSPVEQVIAGVWSDIVGVEQPGSFDNFFALGGNSLHVIQVLTRLRQIFRVDLPARSLLEAPTIDELAQRIRALEARPGQIERIAQVAQRVMQLSAEEKALLRQQKNNLEETLP